MKDYLLFQLYGPFASWGGIAVGEIRPSEDRPTKSAVLGLVAAALGLRRDAEVEQRALAEGLLFAVRVDDAGTHLRDFHTVQVPKGELPPWGRTRADALRQFELQAAEEKKSKRANPLVSYREYRTDPYAVVCLWVKEGASLPWTLSQIQAALERPRFPLYLGRKACPPALPLRPEICEAVSLASAFSRATHFDALLSMSPTVPSPSPSRPSVYWEGDRAEWSEAQEVERWDQPGSRTRWEFSPRREWTSRSL